MPKLVLKIFAPSTLSNYNPCRIVFMKLAHALTLKLKIAIIKTTQVLVRNAQGGLTTVQYVEIKSKIDSAEFVRKNLEGALLFSVRSSIQNYAGDEASAREGIVLEMGVFDGGSINRITSRGLEGKFRQRNIWFRFFQGT